MSDGAPVVSILIVNWNTADLLERCLDSVRDAVTLDHDVIVVDNASEDDSVRRVGTRHPGTHLVACRENLGFARGNNLALEQARGRHLLLLNPDTRVRAGAVESLVEFLETHPRVGIVGPSLWNPDGSPQASVQRMPTLTTELLRQTMIHRLLPRSAGLSQAGGTTRRVDVVTGAALCIRRECYERIGPLDESSFMFYEDVDWCARAAVAGWEVWFVDCAGVVHEKGAASSGDVRTRTLLDSLRGTIFFFRKHRRGGSILALRAIALVGAAARSLRAIVLWVRGSDRPDQRARLRAYRRMITWAVRGGEL